VSGGPIYAPTSVGEYYSTATPAQPTSTGTTPSCGKYHYVASGDTCNGIAVRYGITFATIRQLNTQINEGCTNLWLDYAYCVAPISPPPVSTDGTCGPNYGMTTCVGSAFGSCCSNSGYCGDGSTYCGAGNCCSGACTAPDPGITQDGTCGPDHNNWLCGDSVYGPCCSTSGYCGNTPAHCDVGNCISGACNTAQGGPSTDGSCGPLFAVSLHHDSPICTYPDFCREIKSAPEYLSVLAARYMGIVVMEMLTVSIDVSPWRLDDGIVLICCAQVGQETAIPELISDSIAHSLSSV
jgi:LysM domain